VTKCANNGSSTLKEQERNSSKGSEGRLSVPVCTAKKVALDVDYKTASHHFGWTKHGSPTTMAAQANVGLVRHESSSKTKVYKLKVEAAVYENILWLDIQVHYLHVCHVTSEVSSCQITSIAAQQGLARDNYICQRRGITILSLLKTQVPWSNEPILVSSGKTLAWSGPELQLEHVCPEFVSRNIPATRHKH
jgi:hypothetical protein